MKSQPSDDEDRIPGLAALREVEPPPSLVPSVMIAISQPRPVSFWGWLLRPRRFELRISPMALGALGGLGALVLLAWPASKAPETAAHATLAPVSAQAAVAARTPADVVQVRFVLVAKGAKKVAIVGDFNGWNADGTVLENADGQGTFVATVPLPRGAHEYMFLVDGQWVTDPAAAERRPDGFGRNNAVLRL